MHDASRNILIVKCVCNSESVDGELEQIKVILDDL